MGVRASSPSTAVRVSVVRGGGGGGGPATGGGGADGEPTDDVDTLSAGSLKAATANDCGAKYILHEEWLADVCGVSRRRWVLLLKLDSLDYISVADSVGLCSTTLT